MLQHLLFSKYYGKQNLILLKVTPHQEVDLNNDGVKDIVLSGGVDGVPRPNGDIAINGINGDILCTKVT